jgi:hypothetical protein
LKQERENSDEWFHVDLDSHADTCCVGKDVLLVNMTMKTVKVTSFLQSLGSVTKVPIVTAAIAYDDPRSGKVFILIIHQALHFKELNHCLLCPMQLRLNDVVINERPKFLTTKPTEDDHSIQCQDLLIPLELDGVTSYFPARKPTREEYEMCDRIELTYPDPEWKPNDVQYSEEEAKYVHVDGTIQQQERTIFASETKVGDSFIRGLEKMVLLDDKEYVVSSVATNETFTLSAEYLSRIWGIGLLAAKRTLEATTQRGVRTVAFPNVERRWPTGDRPLRY